MKFKSNYQKVMESLQAEGRVTTLTKEQSFNLDHKMAMGLMPIKAEFQKKERNSRHYISEIERTTSTNYNL
jgi:hypothetical protein